ncbi:MAG: TIGR03364 family FAD-dependent oxidoreductase [Limisphaerales bacterium]
MGTADVAVIGGGIMGLAFAYAQAKRGRSVVIFERNQFAVGASVRNFGLIWPVGQEYGAAQERAMRSRALWEELIMEARLWHAPTGSLHLAYADDETAVLEEFLAGDEASHGRRMLRPAEVMERSKTVNGTGLRGAMWSPTEINIDPRQAVRKLPLMLSENYAVKLRYGTNVLNVDLPRIETSTGDWHVNEAIICTGSDYEVLFPEAFQASGITRCKLQMMRTRAQPQGWALGPSLCAGLTLLHYNSFKHCRALEALHERLRSEYPFHLKNGIHVLLSQTALGELTIGDSHHYGPTPEPFDLEDINAAILEYLYTFANPPVLDIAEYWHGIYAKEEGKTEYVARPSDGVWVVTGLGGAGMTLSFGLAEDIVSGRYQTAEVVTTGAKMFSPS